jgi:two-component system, cell cycle sensor histidine kinase and response regulator CckA
MEAMPISQAVMVVDDDRRVLQYVSVLLRERGYHVLEAANGEDALRAADQYPGPVHLLVTDVKMPGLDGLAPWQRFSEAHPGATVLFMSGEGHDGPRPGTAFVAKPFKSREFLRKIEDLLR